MIKSKFSFLVCFSTLFLSGFVGLGIYFLSHPEIPIKNKFGTAESAAVPGFFLVFGMGAILYFILRQCFILTITPDRLYLYRRFSGHSLPRADIRNIDLNGRISINGSRSEALIVETVDGRKFNLPDWACGNIPRLKNTLMEEYGELVINPPKHAPTIAPRPTDGDNGDTERYSGNYLISQNGIFFFLLIKNNIQWRTSRTS